MAISHILIDILYIIQVIFSITISDLLIQIALYSQRYSHTFPFLLSLASEVRYKEAQRLSISPVRFYGGHNPQT